MKLKHVLVATTFACAAWAGPVAADPAATPAPSPQVGIPAPSPAQPTAAPKGNPAPAAGDASGQTDKSAATDTPDVATLLFSKPQWDLTPVGTVLTYGFTRKVSDPTFGPSFNDRIVEKLDAADAADAADTAGGPNSRTVETRMFSGMNAKPAGPFRSTEQNPVLLLVLEYNNEELSKLFKGNPRYLKDAIRKAWRDHAKIERTSIDVNGKPTPGTRITIQPYLGDEQADRMKGLDGMVYVVEIADSVPGTIAKIDIHAPADGTPKFSEVLRFESAKKP